jgi:diacylglycerol O-acyltransferase
MPSARGCARSIRSCLAAEHAVGIAIVSYDGQVSFGLNADRDSMPDLDVLADVIEAAITELPELIAPPRGALE